MERGRWERKDPCQRDGRHGHGEEAPDHRRSPLEEISDIIAVCVRAERAYME
jgi:hypothetical protein